jgi:RHS repeat-associated protein
MLTNKHFTPVIGLDIHIIVTPIGPIPIPHPFIGLVMDVMDYIPFIGSSVKVNYVPRGICDTSGMIITLFHIPMGGPFLLAPMVGHDSMNFFGSVRVKAESVSLSPAGYMLMTCNDIGIPLSLSPGKKMKPIPSLYLPTSFTIPLPLGKPVNVGGPYAPDLLGILKQLVMSYGFGALMKGLGKGLKKLNHLLPANKFTKGLKKSLCKMGFEPVDLITGRVLYEGVDFELPGVIPVRWERSWYSDSSYEGPMGHGTHHSYDLSLEVDVANVVVIVILPDGRPVAFPYMVAEGDYFYHREEKLTLKCIDKDHYELKDHSQELSYTFEQLQEYSYKPVRIKNTAGFALQLVYDHTYSLVKIIDTAGRELNLSLDKENRITSITARHRGEERLLVSYQYNKAGDLSAIGDALGQQTTIAYKNHLMTSKTDRNGQSFYWEYDGNQTGSRCVHTWGDGGLLEGWIQYKEGHNEVTNSLRETSVYYYNEDLLCTQVKDPLGNSIFHEYTEFMEPYRDIDEEGNVTGYTYDNRGNPKTVVLPNGATTTYVHDDKDRLLLTIQPGGNTDIKNYGEDELLLSIITEDEQITSFDYNSDRLIERIRNNKGEYTQFFYDEDYNLIRVILPNGAKTDWKFDTWGRCIEIKNSEQQVQTFNYDALDRLIRVFFPDYNNIKLEYDAYDEVVSVQDKEHKVNFEYTPLGSLKTREENGTKISFKYNTEEQLMALVNEHGEMYRFDRNANGDIIREEGFDGLQRNYRLNRAGKIIRTERAGNKFSEYEYDLSGNLTQIQHSDGSWEVYNYNMSGELIEAVNENSVVKIRRDKNGVVEKEEQDGYTIQSTYDAMGFRNGITTSLGADISTDNDTSGFVKKLVAEQDSSFWQVDIQYNSLGQELERRMGEVTLTTEYDYAGRVKTHKTKSRNHLKRNKQYEWGVNEKLYKINDLLNHNNISFDYDRFDNLIQSVTNNLQVENFFRDDVGNIFKTKDKKDRKYSSGGKLLKTKENTYSYDEEGNMIRKETPSGDWLYEWKGNGMLKKITRPDKKEVLFEYDALGRRTAKIFNNRITRWIWDGNVPIHEWQYALQERPKMIIDENGMLGKDKEEPIDNLITWVFDEESFKPAAKLINGKAYSIITDYLGTPCEAYDETGERHWECELNGSGKILRLNGEKCFIPFRYQGQYEDEETGLYYNRFRYYAPDEGIYLSQDPSGLIGGDNLYSYVHNSNTWVDVFGLFPHSLRAKVDGGKYKSYTSGGGRGSGRKNQRQALLTHTERKFLDEIEPTITGGEHLKMIGELNPCIPGCQPTIRGFVRKHGVTAQYRSTKTGKVYSWRRVNGIVHQTEKLGKITREYKYLPTKTPGRYRKVKCK